MKLRLEQGDNEEPEILIRGDLTSPQVLELVRMLKGQGKSASKLFLYKNDREYLTDPAEIWYFEAMGNRVEAAVGEQTYEVKYKLYELETLVRGKGFVRISKGVIVNVNKILSVEAEFSGNYTAVLLGGLKRLSISRKYMTAFRKYVMEEY